MGTMSDNFGRALEFKFRQVEEFQLSVTKFAVETIYEIIFKNWPRNTYYSLANHRINIGGTDVLRVEPSKRPTKRGALAGKAESIKASQLQKLNTLNPLKGRKTRTIVIGNAVSYAADVQFIKGNGTALYQQAANEAKAIISAGIDDLRS